MPGSLNYSPSGSEGGRSLGGDLDKSLIGVDLTTTPGKRDRYIGTHREEAMSSIFLSSPVYLDLVSSAMQLLSSPRKLLESWIVCMLQLDSATTFFLHHLPGTTPLKWRKRSSSGSSGGRSVSVTEDCGTLATAKVLNSDHTGISKLAFAP